MPRTTSSAVRIPATPSPRLIVACPRRPFASTPRLTRLANGSRRPSPEYTYPGGGDGSGTAGFDVPTGVTFAGAWAAGGFVAAGAVVGAGAFGAGCCAAEAA